MGYILGVDIGGTKMEAALFEWHHDQGRESCLTAVYGSQRICLNECARDRTSTLRRNGYLPAVERLIRLCKEVLSKSGLGISQINGIGIGMPGPVSPENQVMVTGNSGIFVGRNIRADLAKGLGFSGQILCANDANCFTLAEALAGAAVPEGGGAVSVAGIILGTGVGGGFFDGCRLVSGARGGAAEWGHIQFKANGYPCYCGNQGCAEQYLSGPALEASFAQRIYSQIEKRPNAREIFELSDAKDPVALAVVNQFKKNLAVFLASLTQVVDPDVFVIGGGVSLQPVLYDRVQELMIPSLFIKENPPKVLPNKLGDSAGVIGAALLLFVLGNVL